MGYPVDNVYSTAGDGVEPIGMQTTDMKYIPTLYAGKLLVKFYEASVLSEIANTDYEGMIRDQGDTVIIRTLPDITVRDHEKGMTLVDETPTSEPVTLYIDQGKYWSFRTDDPDYVQTDIKSFVNDWTQEASIELRNQIEQDVLEGVATAAGHLGSSQGDQSGAFDLGVAGTPIVFSKANAVDIIIDCGTVLDESNVPDQGRFFLLPPRLIGNIKKSELKDASLTGDATSVIRNGMVGMIDRFKLFRTGNLKYTSADAAWHCLFGTKHAITFASQLVKSKTIDNPTGFGLLHRGLQVYGYKVVKADALGALYASAS
jgi:hypothetical protein